MSRDGNPWLAPAPGRHRAPVTPKRPLELQLRRRHLAVVAAAMVAMAWLPAELADTVVPQILTPPTAVAAEEPAPASPTSVIPAPQTAVQPRTGVPGSPSTPEPAATVSAPATAVVVAEPTTQPAVPPAPVVTTTAPSPPPAPPSTQPATQPTAQPPVRATPKPTTPRPEPTRLWPPYCGSPT